MELSIITVNYNNVAGLKRTAESVLSQTFREFEWIIVDGGSTDGSKEFVEELTNNPMANISYWCSEKDKGIYNAMNKGVVKAHGEYLNFMNSGDTFYDSDTLEMFSEYKESGSDIYYGNAIILKYDGDLEYKFETPEHLSMEHYLYGGWINHQAAYIRRNLLVDRPYDEKKFRTAADSDFFLYQLCHRTKFEHIPVFMACSETPGLSRTDRGNEVWYYIHKNIVEAFFSKYFVAIFNLYNGIKELYYWFDLRLRKLKR